MLGFYSYFNLSTKASIIYSLITLILIIALLLFVGIIVTANYQWLLDVS